MIATRHLPRPPWPVLALPALLALAGCQSLQSQDNFLGVITPYRIEIVQGNAVTQEQAAQVKPGATRLQVRDILGSPLVTDLFHGDRWDYVFTIRRPGKPPLTRSVVALFEGDLLVRLDAPADLPSEREFVAQISRTSASGRAPVLELSAEQRAALPKPAPVAAAAADKPQGAARAYPPLEPAP